MSNIAVIADIHSNIQALEAVLDGINAIGCDRVYCLGDVVGYGADPGPCIDLLVSVQIPCLLGNHDALVSGQCSDRNFNSLSLVAAQYTKVVLSKSQLDFLSSLPAQLQPQNGVLLVHGSPLDRDRYLAGRRDINDASKDLFEDQGAGLCFFGHTHRPSFFDGTDFWYKAYKSFPLDVSVRSMINPGSVGQPRDGDPRASFALWNQENGLIEFRRVEYDIDGARQRIIDAGLPVKLGDRLLDGV